MPPKDSSSAYDASPFVPHTASLKSLTQAATQCRGCPLYGPATQTVFGEGPRDAALVLVGEQPGDKEDKEGHPFVGPAGRLLDETLEKAGLDRSKVYVTNAVKHFKFEVFAGGTRRIHKKPGVREVRACHPWLEAELALLRPRLIVALGSTAAASLTGRAISVLRERGRFLTHPRAGGLFITVHPSSLLRMGDDPESRHRERELYVADFRKVRERLRQAVTQPASAGLPD